MSSSIPAILGRLGFYLLLVIGVFQLHPQHSPVISSSHHFTPNELFFLDRNYPDYQMDGKAYFEKLKQLMSYDRHSVKRHRGLDHPWALEGPGNIGGRVNAVAVHPEDPNIMLLGYSQGGLYRTADNGETWIPVFDDHPSLSIGHISFDPHDPNKVWATTGDVNISGYYWIGTGVYQSFDAGITWQYRGLDGTGVLSKVFVDPFDPQMIYAGSMGYPAVLGEEKGFFRSTDGGDSWEKTLHIDDSTGIVDMVVDPTQPGRLFATSWTRVRSNKVGTTIGPGTGVYRSDDYGATWVNIENGLPDEIHSRTSIEITNAGQLFVSYIGDSRDENCSSSTEQLRNVYTSLDNGLSWDTIPTGQFHGLPCGMMGGFGWYFEAIKVNPEDPDDIFVLGVNMFRTLDGGLSWNNAAPGFNGVYVHADKHDLAFAHGEIFVGTDGGAYRSPIQAIDGWTDMEFIPSTQYYRTAWNPHTPDWYYGGAQDNGTTGGNGSIFNGWLHFFGGDGFQPRFDPTEPMWMYALTQNGVVWFSEDGGNDFDPMNKGLQGSRYWDMPFVMSTHNPKILYCGSYKMFKMNMLDSLREWQSISPDLTRGDTILGSRYPAITAIAQSDLDSLRLYAGTQDGLVWTSPDGGMDWINITDGTPGLFVTSISCSTINPEGVLVTYSGYRDNDHRPYIYKSDDAGQAWLPIESGLPMMGVNNLFILPERNDEVLIAGTDGGVYVTLDAGLTWDRVGTNFPYMPVYDIDYNPVENKIIAASFSRGILTFPVEELEVTTSDHNSSADTNVSWASIYPTVVSNSLTIELVQEIYATDNIQAALMDMNGRVWQKVKLPALPQQNMELGSALPQGIYLLHLESGLKRMNQKIIIQ